MLLQVMLHAWPDMQAVLVRPTTAGAIREDIAKCCALSMRAAPGAFQNICLEFAAAAVACFAFAGGYSFGRPLCQVLELYAQDLALRPSLAQALQAMLATPAVMQLAQWMAGDQVPELAQVGPCWPL